MKQNGIWVALFMTVALIACNFPSVLDARPSPVSEPTSSEALETAVHFPTSTEHTAVPSTPSPDRPHGPEEAILILEPGPGSRLVSPARVAGLADPTFEQNLVVRIVLEDGAVLAQAPTTIQAEMGLRGPFALDLPFSVQGEVGGLIQVFADSPRDGGIVHLASVGVRLAAQGAAEIKPVEAHLERIHIQQPSPGEVISGGVAHVEGIGIASFEGTLLVQIFDMAGNLVGMQPLIVDAPEMGMPGTFSVDVPYSIASEGPGRVAVVDPLPAFDGVGHISSVEVILKP